MKTPVPPHDITSAEHLMESNVLVVAGNLDLARTYTELHLTSGEIVRLPTELLLSGTKSGADKNTHELASSFPGQEGQSLVMPIMEEQLSVAKRTIATGVVRLHKSVQEYQQTLNETLAVHTFDVQRVVLDRVVDTAPDIRQEGDTTIYPIIEERLVLTKELVLKEELHVTKRITSKLDIQEVMLRKEQITVERIPSGLDPS